ncbi:MAG: hypothetical protein RIR79_1096 [Pseudomonadota bacterium]|jgi:chemotaxis signal transduction protein
MEAVIELNAWLLNFGNNHRAVVGWRELLHLIPEVSLQPLPQTPLHCDKVVVWQNRIIPVWNLGAWLTGGHISDKGKLAVIIGYQPQPGQVPQLGAFLLEEPPVRIAVASNQAGETSASSEAQSPWRDITSSFLTHEHEQLAVLDVRYMFSGLVQPKKQTHAVYQDR